MRCVVIRLHTSPLFLRMLCVSLLCASQVLRVFSSTAHFLVQPSDTAHHALGPLFDSRRVSHFEPNTTIGWHLRYRGIVPSIIPLSPTTRTHAQCHLPERGDKVNAGVRPIGIKSRAAFNSGITGQCASPRQIVRKFKHTAGHITDEGQPSRTAHASRFSSKREYHAITCS